MKHRTRGLRCRPVGTAVPSPAVAEAMVGLGIAGPSS